MDTCLGFKTCTVLSWVERVKCVCALKKKDEQNLKNPAQN